jgi:hypothetical protein
LLPHEAERIRKAETKTPHEVTWAPILWAYKLIQRAKTNKKITLDATYLQGVPNVIRHLENKS